MVYQKFNASFRLLFLALTVLLACFIAIKSLTPTMPTFSITNIDKAAHLLAYFTLGAAALPAFPRVKPLFIWLGLSAFGICIEITQGLLNTGRSLDIWDGIANASGAFLAVLAWLILTRLVQKFT